MRIEKEKEAERRLAELNDSLRKEKLRQDIYYKELLDIENCGCPCIYNAGTQGHTYECRGAENVWD